MQKVVGWPLPLTTATAPVPCSSLLMGGAPAPIAAVTTGFLLSAAYNSGIVFFSRRFGDDLAKIDPHFDSGSCFGILLWGLAYASLATRYHVAPAVALVFAVEKAFYSARWLLWLSASGLTVLPSLITEDPLTGIFYAIYGSGDIVSMFFFAWVAWTWRANVFEPSPSNKLS